VTASSHGPSVPRDPVAGPCPSCGAEDLARYPVLSTGGWYEVVKCQRCFTSVERAPWHRLGSVDRDDAERVAGMAEGVRR
jgi:vanillate/4-hydroxybenzoate decarboxylase subunit D